MAAGNLLGGAIGSRLNDLHIAAEGTADLWQFEADRWTALQRVFGRLPGTGAMGYPKAGVQKASKEETAEGVCAGGDVGLWGFNARL